jgi:hypothetical protein
LMSRLAWLRKLGSLALCFAYTAGAVDLSQPHCEPWREY